MTSIQIGWRWPFARLLPGVFPRPFCGFLFVTASLWYPATNTHTLWASCMVCILSDSYCYRTLDFGWVWHIALKPSKLMTSPNSWPRLWSMKSLPARLSAPTPLGDGTSFPLIRCFRFGGACDPTLGRGHLNSKVPSGKHGWLGNPMFLMEVSMGKKVSHKWSISCCTLW